jgi:hypothetical protein
MKKKKLILIQLNEINFNIFKNKLEKFKNLSKILKFKNTTTYSETDYELLEPWIQWVSVYTGKSASDHRIFRLGDYNYSNEQIYEFLEKNNLKVGAISPMNAFNKLKKPSYFFPDPWAKILPKGDDFNKPLLKTISKLVNNNANNKISLSSAIILLFYLVYYSKLNNFLLYIKIFFKILIGKKWNKALFLDLFLSDIHIKNLKKYNPDFSSVFLNAGAHIQHHYFLNMIGKSKLNPEWYIQNKNDPSEDLFIVYDKIIEDHLKLDQNFDFIIMTALTQTPTNQPTFYYRLKDHQKFLKKFNIKFKEILPRMTRDFTINFENKEEAKECENLLNKFTDKDKDKLFGVIDNRGVSLFVSFTYSKEIKKESKFFFENIEANIFDDLVFVAIKNGIHNHEGYLFASNSISVNKDPFHVKETYNLIKDYFFTREVH